MVDVATIRAWLEKLDYDVKPEGDKMLRVVPRRPGAASLPPYYVQCSEHWVLLSLLPVLPQGFRASAELPRRLLLLNRDMRIAKFAKGEQGEVILCAELPTESLDYSEFADVTERLVKYYNHYRDYLCSP
jgi:Tir chaperone protein (CesT) family